jgi:acyl-CoA synthetase (AMP-forming)/AMP-acid ligase II
MNLAALLENSGRSFAARPALTIGTTVTATYGALNDRAARIAGGLRRLGLRDGERVAIAMSNGPAFYEAMFGIWRAGLVAVPINAKLHPSELAYIIESSGSRVAFADAALGAALTPLAGTAGLGRIIVTDSRDYLVLASSEPMPVATLPGEAPAWLFYTSGTTGRPKGATLTHRNLLMMILSYFADLDWVEPQDCILHAAPMSHGSGLYGLCHIAKAANNVIPESGGFDAAEIFALITRHPGLTMFAAPTMVVRLINSPAAGGDTRNLRLIVYGGGPMYVAHAEQALDLFGPKLAQIYGLGESPMTITSLSRACHAERDHPRYRERLGSAGIARTGVEVRVVDTEDGAVPVGENGEVAVRGDVVMPGYWQNPAATAETIRGGWLHTGDIGSVDADGFLTLKDRSKDLIISGGSNIYPREVEEVLMQHESVLEATVVGRPDPEWGEEVVAFVVLRPGRAADEKALDRYCLDRMARFKRPRRYHFVESLPKNNYGKVLKRSLRERLGDG